MTLDVNQKGEVLIYQTVDSMIIAVVQSNMI